MSDQGFSNRVRVCQDIASGNPQNVDSAGLQPGSSSLVARWPVARVVYEAIDLDRQLRSRAIEIEDVRTDRLLAPEVEVRSLQPRPE
jgi:hypothetical protein